jgi:hypothetical protein
MAPWSIRNRVFDTAWTIIAQKTLGIPTVVVPVSSIPAAPTSEEPTSEEPTSKAPVMGADLSANEEKMSSDSKLFVDQYNNQTNMVDMYMARKYMEQHGRPLSKDGQDQWGLGDPKARVWVLRR